MQRVDGATSGAAQAAPTEAEITAFQVATRDLIDIAIRGVELVAPELTLPQFRLMLALAEYGPVSSVGLAHTLDVAPSSVTRMVDRLLASGHVDRTPDPDKRSVVSLALSPLGSRAVADVLRWRHRELSRVLGQVAAEDRAVAARALSSLHRVVDRDPEHSHLGWLPL
ncbi:MAG TPA: MarR family transcriptional regulator [Microbacterium sp.]|uniref:MarR family winged helix-turn-helix transcriptional regulator n=1 Tax=Microbacterium sp. TaxID=51671 RepID=UPI002B45E4A6|nr:MarR family transcriptional regulator [Microbacterium sp.]HKT56469.1 MarR family transcriptional regulator [Microbacterium sp.]